ncbi:MAG: hypothetical protein LUE98_11920 [Tannerellaceae bacterium]|nr:hypothetical protein [Tannerellaceae bacterium]
MEGKIKMGWQDIKNLISVLSISHTLVCSEIEEAKKLGSEISLAQYTEWLERTKKGSAALHKLRKELRLFGDPLYGKLFN